MRLVGRFLLDDGHFLINLSIWSNRFQDLATNFVRKRLSKTKNGLFICLSKPWILFIVSIFGRRIVVMMRGMLWCCRARYGPLARHPRKAS
jgi:hypothetical protein